MVWAEVLIEDSIQNIENRLIQARQFRFSQQERNENELAEKRGLEAKLSPAKSNWING
jgi:hypothetical protein